MVDIEFGRQYVSTTDIIGSNAATVRGLIFNGDVDMVCNGIGNEWSIEDLAKNLTWSVSL